MFPQRHQSTLEIAAIATTAEPTAATTPPLRSELFKVAAGDGAVEVVDVSVVVVVVPVDVSVDVPDPATGLLHL